MARDAVEHRVALLAAAVDEEVRGAVRVKVEAGLDEQLALQHVAKIEAAGSQEEGGGQEGERRSQQGAKECVEDARGQEGLL